MLKDRDEFVLVSRGMEFRSLGNLPLYQGRVVSKADDFQNIQVGLVQSVGQRQLICELLDRMYGWRGYKDGGQLPQCLQSFTFGASIDSRIVATLTLNVDSEHGLSADETFHDLLDDARRKPGASLCELSKFASEPSQNSRVLLACLFHAIYTFGTEHFGCTDLFIEVNPRHIRFYEAMLGFQKCGSLRTNMSVDAPSQLMMLKVSEIGRQIEKCAALMDETMSRSLYPLIHAANEQRDLIRNAPWFQKGSGWGRPAQDMRDFG